MVIVLDKNISKKELAKKLKRVVVKKRLGNKKRFFGALKWSVDPLEYQKKLRNEWA